MKNLNTIVVLKKLEFDSFLKAEQSKQKRKVDLRPCRLIPDLIAENERSSFLFRIA